MECLENVPEDQPDYFDGTTLQEERKISATARPAIDTRGLNLQVETNDDFW